MAVSTMKNWASIGASCAMTALLGGCASLEHADEGPRRRFAPGAVEVVIRMDEAEMHRIWPIVEDICRPRFCRKVVDPDPAAVAAVVEFPVVDLDRDAKAIRITGKGVDVAEIVTLVGELIGDRDEARNRPPPARRPRKPRA